MLSDTGLGEERGEGTRPVLTNSRRNTSKALIIRFDIGTCAAV
jgi:hypothetical protein